MDCGFDRRNGIYPGLSWGKRLHRCEKKPDFPATMVLKWYVVIMGFGGIRGKSTNPCVDPLANQQWGLW